MVFCYKIITESPRRSRCASPRKLSTIGRYSSDLISSYDYEGNKEDIWDSIPEREWKLLAALARKREEEHKREDLAEQFQKMWLKEKEDREMVAAENSEQYKRYINQKRAEEKYHNEYRRLQLNAEQDIKTYQLLHSIRYKEQKSADLLAWRDDRKASELVGRALEEEARAHCAAERRGRRGWEERARRLLQLQHARHRADDAGRRRSAMLRNASQRLAITNTLSSWETSLIRQEVAAMDAAKRAHAAFNCAQAQARGEVAARARDTRRRRARRAAALAALMRDAIKSGRAL